MPRYFFDVINGEGPMRDDEGVELPDPDAVRREAAKIVTDLARDEVPKEQAVKIVVNVRDEADAKVFVGQLHYSGDWQG
ncbi:DUF6894 family protein [Sinorhizobium meliloti]|jgi:hypothetical protein|uniref:DUF6894 family protein n=2 Tax=Rhizobium meliloti TaxID=382 RepID=UPI0012957F80|nr:hypothetical protein [Sinorhizobium meliloti]MDE3854850.1 hypothetical protein [Sinorhizobium meliloti]MQW52526.1 hypothetical protein [Sinorhizobium meliloti]